MTTTFYPGDTVRIGAGRVHYLIEHLSALDPDRAVLLSPTTRKTARVPLSRLRLIERGPQGAAADAEAQRQAEDAAARHATERKADPRPALNTGTAPAVKLGAARPAFDPAPVVKIEQGVNYVRAEHADGSSVALDTSPAPAPDTDVVEFARLGYRVSLDWRVPVRDWATFAAAVTAAGGYNRFDPAAIVDTFEPLFAEASCIEFGRESSPVLYVGVPFYPGQRLGYSGGTGERYAEAERIAYVRRVLTWGAQLHADERMTIQSSSGIVPPTRGDNPGENPHRVRLWWD